METVVMEILEIEDLGLSKNMAKFMSECAQFCFYTQNHNPGVTMNMITDNFPEDVCVSWEQQNMKKLQYSMNNHDITTEFGAYGMSLVLTWVFSKYKFFMTAGKFGGFDFWLFEEEPEELDYRKASARLEVSGIRKETKSNSVDRRLEIKRLQIKKSDYLCIAGCVGVVEFDEPKTVFEWQY